jgi:hypothetical protein
VIGEWCGEHRAFKAQCRDCRIAALEKWQKSAMGVLATFCDESSPVEIHHATRAGLRLIAEAGKGEG